MRQKAAAQKVLVNKLTGCFFSPPQNSPLTHPNQSIFTNLQTRMDSKSLLPHTPPRELSIDDLCPQDHKKITKISTTNGVMGVERFLRRPSRGQRLIPCSSLLMLLSLHSQLISLLVLRQFLLWRYFTHAHSSQL